MSMRLSEKQKEIIKFQFEDYDSLICSGAIRSGKTTFMFITFVDWAMSNFNQVRFGVCGKTVGTTHKNIISPFLNITYIREKYRIKQKFATNEIIITNGETTNIFELFGGKDKSSADLIQGRTLGGIFFDEVVLQPKEFVSQGLSRLSIEGAKSFFSCNPSSPKHWFYTDWIKRAEHRNAKVLEFELTDNPSLSEKTIQMYKTQFSGVFYDRYILGKWVVADGLVYNFNQEKHLKEFEEGNIKPWVRYYLSIDYGITNPFACLLWAVDRGKAYCLKEYYYNSKEKDGRTLTDEEHYNNIVNLCEGYKIDMVVIDPSATSMKALINRKGTYSVKDANNKVLEGISNTMTLLDQGKLLFSSKCENTISEFGLYSWNKDTTQGDTVIKENDHALDSVRYFVNTVLRRDSNFF